MPTHNDLLVVPVIPGVVHRGSVVRSDVSYAAYGIATWDYWCRQHGVELVLLDQPQVDRPIDVELPPTVQRWIGVRRILMERGPHARVAMVDADTMVRWDTPNLFELTGNRVAAVRDGGALWIHRSITAYQHLFPSVSLPWWEYINAGLIVLEAGHIDLLDALIDTYRRRWPQLVAVQASGNFGSDQTILNFLITQRQETLTLLPPTFNYVRCFPLEHELMTIELDGSSACDDAARAVCDGPGAFDFVGMAYVWHFTNVVSCRRVVMEETWRRVHASYPGARPGLPFTVANGA